MTNLGYKNKIAFSNSYKKDKKVSSNFLNFIRKFIQEFTQLFSSSYSQENISLYFKKQKHYLKCNEKVILKLFDIIQNLCENINVNFQNYFRTVSYTHLRAHETRHDLVCRLLLEKKKKKKQTSERYNYTI
eukprot:TRINITY_DN37221_c0_g1_i1.p1 TRINITY_DN37221_c0_g1~~TRINITY_DN37221_c0_g1_i1.p1  ORF type:complete len:131 (+),score=26.17 TRINITY_DN37221_c0_g1_i1:50-442(+)